MGKLDKFKQSSKPISTKEEIQKVNLAMERHAAEMVFKKIPLEQILFNPDNDYAKYDTDEELSLLADDIFHNSLLHNIVVNFMPETRQYILISGERRVRAYLKLKNDPERNKNGDYNLIQAKVYKELSPRISMIMLDAANLQTRGGVGNEVLYRNSVNRYIDNMKAEYGISEDAAMMLAKKASSVSNRTVENARSVQTKLLPELVKLIDEGTLPKKWSLALLNLSAEEQSLICKILVSVRDASYIDKHSMENTLRDVVQKIVSISDISNDERYNAYEKLLADVLIKSKNRSDETPRLPKTHTIIHNSRQAYIHNIESIQDKIKKLNNRKKLESLAALAALPSEEGENVLECLNNTLEEMRLLKKKVELIVLYNQQLESGKGDDGKELSERELRNIKKLRKSVLLGDVNVESP